VLKDKKILLGVSGGIAAYKIPSLVRLYKKAGAEVKIILTPASLDFVSPLVLSTLSGNKVVTSTISADKTSWENHVELALWADVFVVAPATANTIAKMAHGICDNLLLAVYLSAKCPVMFAPAMDLDMYKHPTFTNNRKLLLSYGNVEIPAEDGFLASGLIGKGRLAEVDHILWQTIALFSKEGKFQGKKILINAGPTHEAIDPVRFIGNRSTGKMGIALAEEAARQGGEVHLVLGPTTETVNHPLVKVYRIESADELFDQCTKIWKTADIAILSAAVADYKPKSSSSQKIKKDSSASLNTIDLVENKDVLKTLGKTKKEGQVLVGFALETNNAIEFAKKKIEKKNLDFIVVNTLEDKGAGFGHSTNKVSIITKRNKIDTFELKSKTLVAKDILNSL